MINLPNLCNVVEWNSIRMHIHLVVVQEWPGRRRPLRQCHVGWKLWEFLLGNNAWTLATSRLSMPKLLYKKGYCSRSPSSRSCYCCWFVFPTCTFLPSWPMFYVTFTRLPLKSTSWWCQFFSRFRIQHNRVKFFSKGDYGAISLQFESVSMISATKRWQNAAFLGQPPFSWHVWSVATLLILLALSNLATLLNSRQLRWFIVRSRRESFCAEIGHP